MASLVFGLNVFMTKFKIGANTNTVTFIYYHDLK